MLPVTSNFQLYSELGIHPTETTRDHRRPGITWILQIISFGHDDSKIEVLTSEFNTSYAPQHSDT